VLPKPEDKNANGDTDSCFNSLKEMLRSDRFKIRNPFELLQEFETVLPSDASL
jgi:hypothetical protein